MFPALTLGLSLGLLLLLGLALALSLDVLVVDCKSLVDLGLESSLILNTSTKLASCFELTVGTGTYRLMSSLLSISRSIPVIFPARSPLMAWILGKSISPSICFC